MSESPSIRRRQTVRVCRLFWCHQCLRTVRIIASRDLNVFCPRCYGRFLHELDFPRPRLPADYMGLTLDPSPLPHFLDYLSTALGLSDSWVIFRQPNSDPAADHPEPPRQHFDPVVVGPELAPEAEAPLERAVPPAMVRPDQDYFTGPGLGELIEGLTQNDRPGPAPAPASAIDAIPKVTIEEVHLADASQCPVCKEDFVLGEEALEMPCGHVYHADCLLPWLRQHNSCPVCRYALPSCDADDARENPGRRADDSSPLGAGRRAGWGWNPFALLRPFISSFSPGPGGGSDAYGSWWRSWFLL